MSLRFTPYVSYHKFAKVGGKYQVSVFLEWDPGEPWPYQKDSYRVRFLVMAGDFHVTPVRDPVTTIHRNRITSDDVKFMLVAEKPSKNTNIYITMVNEAGVPMHTIKLKYIQIDAN